MELTDWLRLFPAADYRLAMGLRPGDAARFWSRWDDSGQIMAERRRWLQEMPERLAASLPEAASAAEEAGAWMRSFAPETEPDWVILSADRTSEPRVIAGEVIFPSSWSLPDKLGQPMSMVHEPVPSLQKQMGGGIQSFLSRLEAGSAWERENWGLAADAELNHHPSRAIPKLAADARPERAWIRLEHQFLTRLPESQAVLFGIRVACHRLDRIASLPGMAERIATALRTMPDEIARYKGLAAGRESLVAALAG